MKIKPMVVLPIITLFTWFGVNETYSEMGVFGERIIKHRANVGGDCDDRENCVGIVGNKVYNYQKIERYGEKLSLKDMDNVEKGKLAIDQKGLMLSETTREKFNLNESDAKGVRSVHQYMEIERDIKGKFDGKELDLGNIENINNRKIRNITSVRLLIV